MYYDQSDIDPETGLARLPENQFWRVEHRKTFSTSEKPIFDLFIIQRDVTTKEGLNWYGKKVTKTKTREHVAHKGYVWEGPNGSEFSQYVSSERLKYSTFYERGNYHTEVAKREAAKKHAAENSAYLGDYPPKSINREETN